MTLNRTKISGFANVDVFDVCVANYGTGYLGLHVKVGTWEEHPSTGSAILLTRDAQNFQEFELHIEELKLLLDDLKVKAKRKFTAIAKKADEEKKAAEEKKR